MRLNCINFVSTEPERLRSFYAMILQKPYNEIVPGRNEILVGGVKLAFTRTSVQTPVNPDSCGLEFAVEDVDAQYRRLKQAGGTEPVTYPWGWRAFGFCDPDGNHIDFVQQLDGGK